MQRPNPIYFLGFLLVLLAVLGGLGVAKGAVLINRHDGDALHLLQIVLRMAEGQVPHLDFMTPIGALAFAPIAVLIERGLGAGAAFLWAQVLVAAVLLPAVWRAGVSRLPPALAYVFGAAVLSLCLALVYGGRDAVQSVSMHYNRWAWALAFVAIVMALRAPVRARAGLDGALIGLLMAGLALIKVTYFAAFAPAVVLGLWLTSQRAALGVALGAGLVVAGAVTLVFGLGYWTAYLGDLRTVAGSAIRAQPSGDFATVVAAPAYLGGTLAGILGVIFLRQAGRRAEGALLLILLPGLWYVTYQNFGNDPKWLVLLAVLLLSWLPARELRNGLGWSLRGSLVITAVAALAFALPSYLNLLTSPGRHYAAETEDFLPFLPQSARHSDIRLQATRAARVDAKVALEAQADALRIRSDAAARKDETTWRGEALPNCTVETGMPAWFDAIARDLEAAGLAQGQGVFMADILNGLWMFGGTEPLRNGAPWYYGGLPGIEDAAYVLIPLCPVIKAVRQEVLADLEAADLPLTEVRRTPLYILLAKG